MSETYRRYELRELGQDWSPWTWQVLTWAGAREFGYGHGEIIVGTWNFKSKVDALDALARLRGEER